VLKESPDVLYSTLYGILLVIYNKADRFASGRTKAVSALAVTVATEVFLDAEATRKDVY
jgi:hypothetical protein